MASSVFRFLLLLPVILFSKGVFSQTSDTLRSKALKPEIHSPHKATLMSTAVPGLGQIYNKKYWKVPIIYAGIGVATYFYFWNKSYYKAYLSGLQLSYDTAAVTGNNLSSNSQYILESNGYHINPDSIFIKKDGLYYNQNQLTVLKNYYRYDRDLSAIAIIVTYVLNIVDADVDAHFFSFDVSDDISLRVTPAVFSSNTGMPVNGLSVALRW